MTNWGQITSKYITKQQHTAGQSKFSQTKRTSIHITFINFSWPRIEKNDITATKVIGTALNKPNLPYIIFVKSTWTLIRCSNFNLIFENRCFYLSDWIWNKLPYFQRAHPRFCWGGRGWTYHKISNKEGLHSWNTPLPTY